VAQSCNRQRKISVWRRVSFFARLSIEPRFEKFPRIGLIGSRGRPINLRADYLLRRRRLRLYSHLLLVLARVLHRAVCYGFATTTQLTKNGIRPFSRSCAMASFSRSPRRLKLSSHSMYRIFTNPIRPAFSTDECACENTSCAWLKIEKCNCFTYKETQSLVNSFKYNKIYAVFLYLPLSKLTIKPIFSGILKFNDFFLIFSVILYIAAKYVKY
jgi:hypothetical protein